MIKIGDFSKLSQLSIKTLRYYDELGLLKPVHVDRYSGYRYYSAAQLPRLQRIMALKDLGLSLQQIGMLLDDDLPSAQVMGLLRRKQVELRLQISESEVMLSHIESRLKQFEQENSMPDKEVVIKSVPAMWIVSVRGTVPTYPAQGSLWAELEKALRSAGLRTTGPCFTIDHDLEHKESDHDLEVCYAVDGQAELSGLAKVRQLQAVEKMASLIHHGPFNTLYQSYNEMLKWLDANAYQIIGPGREIYISTGPGPVRQDDQSYVTEIQFPVQKA
jgi:DNA-binding transcriptional MerR regulator/effector-binding domain-containing protein